MIKSRFYVERSATLYKRVARAPIDCERGPRGLGERGAAWAAKVAGRRDNWPLSAAE